MEWLTELLSGLEAPFPLGFVIVLALALYVLGNRIVNAANDPNNPKPLCKKYLVTRNNIIIGIVASILWMAASYVTTFGFIFLPVAIQYFVIACISGITASGLSTTVYELIKNKLKLKALLTEEAAEVQPEVVQTETEEIKEEITNDSTTNSSGDVN